MLRKFLCLPFVLITAAALAPLNAHAQTADVTTLYSFSAVDQNHSPYPSELIQASDGNFYGTTEGFECSATPGTCGIIYMITPAGTFTTIHSFSVTDGGVNGGLVEGGDGNFYGTSQGSTIFKLTPSGIFTTIYTFCAGCGGTAGLTLGNDGSFYGVTSNGGNNKCGNDSNYAACGTIFKVTPSGTLTTIYNFCSVTDTKGGCLDGGVPLGGLIQGSDGNFYGTTIIGGTYASSNCFQCSGTLFKVTPSGTLTTLHSFCGLEYCPDGSLPETALVEADNGNFYGVTPLGGIGNNNGGTAFSVTPSGTFTTVHSFCGGSCPYGAGSTGLVVGSDGNLYGTTYKSTTGFLFQMTPTGTTNELSSLVSGAKGGYPDQPLVQASDGTLYGSSYAGGANGYGSIYQATVSPALAAPVQLSLSSPSTEANESVTLSWKVLNAFSQTLQQCYAFVQNSAAGAGTWTGLQTGTVVNGVYQGSSNITPIAGGTYTYALTCGGTESGFASLSVTGKSLTATTLTSNSPYITGDIQVTLSATVSSSQSTPVPTGTVDFSYGSIMALGNIPLINGTASTTVQGEIPVGTFKITGNYSGDDNYIASTGTTIVVVLGYPTTTSLTAVPTTLAQGQPVTLSAKVARSGNGGMPFGSVSFYYGSTYLGKANLVGNSTATYTAATNGSILPGTYAVTAKYTGDATDQPSTSPPVDVTVIAATTITLSATPNPVPANHDVTLTAQVNQTYGSAYPTGTVTFVVGSYFIGRQPLSSGVASLDLSSAGLSAGTYQLTAQYSGDANNAASSKTINVTLQ